MRNSESAEINNLKLARLAKGLNIVEAAKAVGLSTSFLFQIETGERSVDSEKAEIIAEVYGIDKNKVFEAKRYISK